MKKLLLVGLMIASSSANAANLLMEVNKIQAAMSRFQMVCKIYDNGKVDVDVLSYYDDNLIKNQNVTSLFSSSATFKFDKKYIAGLINAAEVSSNLEPSITDGGSVTYVFKNKSKMKLYTPTSPYPSPLMGFMDGVCYQHGVKSVLGIR
ncbi:MAG: hypothetical protein WCI06_00510 [Methylococcaceae bacterium]